MSMSQQKRFFVFKIIKDGQRGKGGKKKRRLIFIRAQYAESGREACRRLRREEPKLVDCHLTAREAEVGLRARARPSLESTAESPCLDPHPTPRDLFGGLRLPTDLSFVAV